MRIFMALILMVAGLAAPLTASAQKITLLTGERSPYVSDRIENHGFAAEVVTYAFLSVGIEAEFKFTSWENCEALVAQGKYFAAFPQSRTIERQSFAYFSEPIAMSKGIFFYLKEKIKKLDFNTVADLKGYRIGGVKGYHYVPMFLRAGLDVDYSSNAEFAFKKLYLGSVDIVPENEFVGWLIVQKLFPDEMFRFGFSRKAYNQDSLYLMVSKKYPDAKGLMTKFNEGLRIIQEKGIYRKLVKKYIKHTDIRIPKEIY